MYLEGMEEASVFVHVTVNDITGKVGRERLSSVANRQKVTCGFRWVWKSLAVDSAASSWLEFQM